MKADINVGHVEKTRDEKVYTKFNYRKGKSQGKAHPRTDHEGPERE